MSAHERWQALEDEFTAATGLDAPGGGDERNRAAWDRWISERPIPLRLDVLSNREIRLLRAGAAHCLREYNNWRDERIIGKAVAEWFPLRLDGGAPVERPR